MQQSWTNLNKEKNAKDIKKYAKDMQKQCLMCKTNMQKICIKYA